jgi:hypothetical protein
MESGTHELARGSSLAEIERACDDVDVAVAEVAVCVDVLARLAAGDEPAKAAGDARQGLRRICAAIDGLRSSCQRVRASMNDRTSADQVATGASRRR